MTIGIGIVASGDDDKDSMKSYEIQVKKKDSHSID